MIWKLYKAATLTSIRCVLMTIFEPDSSEQIDRQLRYVSQLKRIIRCVRAYQALHPAFATTTYGNLAGYLQQHLAAPERAVLLQLLHPASMPTEPGLAFKL